MGQAERPSSAGAGKAQEGKENQVASALRGSLDLVKGCLPLRLQRRLQLWPQP